MNELETFDDYLSRHSFVELRAKARAWQAEAEKLEDRIFYELSLTKKTDPQLRADAKSARDISNAIRRYLAENAADE